MNLNEEFGDFVRIVRGLKSRAEQLSASSAIADITYVPLRRLTEQFAAGRVQLATIKDSPGIGAHAQAATNLPGADLAADYAAIVAGIDTVIAEIDGILPRAAGWATVINMAANGVWSDRAFTSAQTSGLRTILNTFVAGLPAWIERQT